MRYLLDSDSLSDLYNSDALGHAAIARRVTTLREPDQVVLSILALYEAEYGRANAPEEKRAAIRQRISHMQTRFEILPLTPEAAHLFGSLKVGLSRIRGLSPQGSKRHNMDVMLAATAAAENCVLISADSLYSDLRKVNASLQVENWLG
jgi:predicted nucleic acid-binding protein